MNCVRVLPRTSKSLDARSGWPAIDSAARVRVFDVDLRFDTGQQTFEKICSSRLHHEPGYRDALEHFRAGPKRSSGLFSRAL